jgi:hypothetical protein
MRSHFEVVQNFELNRIGGAPKGHQFTPLFHLKNVLFVKTPFVLVPKTLDH